MCIIEWVYIINVNMVFGKVFVMFLVNVVRKWWECYFYEVMIFVIVGMFLVDEFEDVDVDFNYVENYMLNDVDVMDILFLFILWSEDGWKGSIVFMIIVM